MIRAAVVLLPLLVVGCGGSDPPPPAPASSSGSSSSSSGSSGAPPANVDGGGTNAAGSPTWSSLASLPFAQQETAVLTLDAKIFVLGGFDAAGAVLNVVHVYDPKTNAWSTAAPLPKPLHHINAAVVGGQIWIVGGLIDRNFVQTGDILAFDPKTNQWTPKGSMPAGSERGASFTAATGDTIFVAGGLRGGASVATFSSYNTTNNTWNTALAPLPTARDHGAGAANGSVFLAVSGRGGGINAHTTRVDAFDATLVGSTWTDKSAPIPTSRGGFALATLEDGRIVVMGGEGDTRNSSGVFPEVEIYEPRTNTWSALPPMKTPRHGMGAAAIGKTIYVPGGGVRQAFAATDVVEALTFE